MEQEKGERRFGLVWIVNCYRIWNGKKWSKKLRRTAHLKMMLIICGMIRVRTTQFLLFSHFSFEVCDL